MRERSECLWRKTKISTVSKLLQRLGEPKYMIPDTSRSLEWKESPSCFCSVTQVIPQRGHLVPATQGLWDVLGMESCYLKSLGKHFHTWIRKEVRGGEEGEKQKRGENERKKGWKYGSSPSFALVSEMKLTWSVKNLQNVVQLRCQLLPSWHGAWHMGNSLINCWMKEGDWSPVSYMLREL